MPGKSVVNRGVEEFNPGPNGSYRQWVDYRQKLEINEFLAQNKLSVEEAAHILFEKLPNEGKRNDPNVVLIRGLLYKQKRSRILTQESYNMLEHRERELGKQYLSWPNKHFIYTGIRKTIEEEELEATVRKLREENEALRQEMSNLQATNRAFRELIDSRKK